MVARNLKSSPAANQVTAGVAHVRHDDAIVAESAGNNRGSHTGSTWAGSLAELIDAGIGGLHKPRHQDGVGFSSGSGTKPGDQRFYGRLGSHLTQLFTADTVGHRAPGTARSEQHARQRESRENAEGSN